MDNSYIFRIHEAIFRQFSVVFNTLLPAFIKALCTSVIKYPATTSEWWSLMVPFRGFSLRFTVVMVNPCFFSCDSARCEGITLTLLALEKFQAFQGSLCYFVSILETHHAQTLLYLRLWTIFLTIGFLVPTASHSSTVLTQWSCLISISVQLLSAVTAIAEQPLQDLSPISDSSCLKCLT